MIDSLFITFLVIHVLVSILLIIAVLIQGGKESDLASAFGGGFSQTIFGSRAGNVMTRITTGLAVAFMSTCLILAVLASRGGNSRVFSADKKIPASTSGAATDAKTQEADTTSDK